MSNKVIFILIICFQKALHKYLEPIRERENSMRDIKRTNYRDLSSDDSDSGDDYDYTNFGNKFFLFNMFCGQC